MKIFRLSGFMFTLVAFLLTSSVMKADEMLTGDVKEILKLHKGVLESHIGNDVNGILASESEQIVVVSRGEVQFPSRSERVKQFKQYLKGVEFEEYRDLISPIVRVSDDGTLGWLITQVKITGTHNNSDGKQIPFESIWS